MHPETENEISDQNARNRHTVEVVLRMLRLDEQDTVFGPSLDEEEFLDG